mgnify:CR=1 FL=1|tara:strand:+ start:210 stop:719 length:510 start_codon:yes stop_codon:yes gene_type:complete
MFGLFKPKMAPEGPVEIEMDMEIERSAEDIYAMVDFGDPRHHKAAVGTITRTGDKTFQLVVDMLPDIVFPIVELEAVPHSSYIIESVLPDDLDGRLHKTVESIAIEPLEPDRCKVTASTLAYFHPMKLKHFDMEVAMITMACNNSLVKLKIHAEEGVDTIRDIETQQMA